METSKLTMDRDTPVTEFGLSLPVGMDAAMWSLVEENGWNPSVTFAIGDLGASIADKVLELIAEHLGVSDIINVVFADGSMVNDESSIEMQVLRSMPFPDGLMGTTWEFDVRVRFPSAMRYTPDGD